MLLGIRCRLEHGAGSGHACRRGGTGDFGVAMYCGFGRQPGADGTETMREHARVVRAAGSAERP